MPNQFDGKVALVTGGNSGIGRAAAIAFAREGAKVIVAARREKEGNETVATIKLAGGEATFVKTDVTVPPQVETLVDEVVGIYGRLDCAFNNAGVEGGGVRVHEYTPEYWNEVIAVNLTGVWLCMKYEVTQMLKQGVGVIVNNSSSDGLVGDYQSGAYVASKHGVVGLTKAAALEYAREGIRVNAVCPGWVRTPMTEGGFAGQPLDEKAVAEVEPMGRIGLPEEIASAVLWLCSDASSFVTGHSLAVDGGLIVG